jgi:hypothetical protein
VKTRRRARERALFAAEPGSSAIATSAASTSNVVFITALPYASLRRDMSLADHAGPVKRSAPLRPGELMDARAERRLRASDRVRPRDGVVCEPFPPSAD